MTFQILLVDDEPHVVDAIRSILEKVNSVEVEIHTAYRAQQALEICRQFPISLIVADIRMPGMNGLELVSEVRSINPDCKIIFLTAYSDFSYAYEGLRLHVSDYILKTEESAVIQERIVRVLKGMEKELLHLRWLEESEQIDPIRANLFEKLFGSERLALQEQAFSLLGFQTKEPTLLLAVCKGAKGVPLRTALMAKAMKRYLGARINQVVYSRMKNGYHAFLMSVSPEVNISTVWLIGSMERAQAAYNVTTHEESYIFVSPLVHSIEKLSGLYQQAVRTMDENVFEPCVRLLSDEDKTVTHVTVQFIKNYIKTHICEELSLSQLSKVTGYNTAYLSRLFKEHTGETLLQYISRRRMAYITELMKNPEFSIQQIMETTGFPTYPSFIQFIKKETGLTPKKYRMLLGEQSKELLMK